MRRLLSRPLLTQRTINWLNKKAVEVNNQVDPELKKSRARDLFDQARGAVWFAPIVDGLRGLCGEGELCMYCSSNEPSQLEHYKPLSLFPQEAFFYDNYLWSCDICNRSYKGSRFPPISELGDQILNPLDEDVWEFFFLDEDFGRLQCRVDPITTQKLPRSVSTCEVVGIDRENVQIKRQRRYRSLKLSVQNILERFQSGHLGQTEVRSNIAELRSEPFQADVADYFLNGPGRIIEPFRALLAAAGE